MDTLETLSKMSKENNKELKLSPLSNIISAQSGKEGWGSVTIAIPNDIVAQMSIDANYYVGGLVLAKGEEFEKYKTERQ